MVRPREGAVSPVPEGGEGPRCENRGEMRALRTLVPMGRGCGVEDVVRAILYLVEQEYETGQALPVTGGQVMIR